MSVCGVDFGNLSMLVAQCSKGGVDVMLNDSSNRQTATAASVQGKQRFLGDSGAAMARSNIKNTVSSMKLLVGRKFADPEVQAELARAAFSSEALPSGGVGIRIQYNDEPIVVPAEHFLAMLLVKAKEIASNANGGVGIGDSVLAVPASFNDAQRRGMLHACEIASLNCLKVNNESAAIALSYGIFKSAKKQFSETEKTNIMFVDMGYTSFSVTVVAFQQGSMKILASVADGSVGGRNYDDEIVEYLAETFQDKTKIDVRENKKAILKLMAAAEKAKKTLSPAGVKEANISVECLAEDMDLNAKLTTEEFETRTQKWNDKLAAPIEQCIKEASVAFTDIFEVEIVGGGSRVNMVKKTIGKVCGLDPELLNYGLKTTMNADEAVARGNALQCAMLSSRIRVQPFSITDKLYYGVIATYDATSTGLSDEGKEDEQKSSSAQLYSRGDDVPHKPRRLTFRKKSADFSVTLSYDGSMGNEDKFIAKYLVKIPAGIAPQDVRVTFNIDKHSCVYLQSAEMLEEVIEEPKAEEEAPVPMETESKEDEEKAADAKDGEEQKEGEEKVAPADTPAKKRFRKTDLETSLELTGLSTEDVKVSIELEANMAFEDHLITETADKRNELESYIYDMRAKAEGALKEYSTADEKAKFSALLMDSEEWLYGDGFESTKSQYKGKLDELLALGNPIVNREAQDTNRPAAIDSLKKQIELCKSFAQNYDEKYKHIEEEDRDKLRTEAKNTEEWMFDMIGNQGNLAKSTDPVLTIEGISMKRNDLFKVSNPIMTKRAPVPTPAPAPAPTEDPKKEEGEAKEGTEGEAKNEEKTENAEEGKTEGDSKEGEENTDKMDEA